MKFLITNHYIKTFTGSEINVLQVGQALKARGHDVDVATFIVGNPMCEMLKGEGIKVFDLLKDEPVPMAYDVIWAHHGPVLTQLLFKFPVEDTRIIFSSLAPLEPLEAPPIFLDAVHYYLVNSDGNRARMIAYGIPEEKIHYFPNFSPHILFLKSKPHQATYLRRIGIVSNHPPAELRNFADIARQEDVRVDFIGHQDNPVYVDEQVLLPYDLIVTIGKTVQYCFSLKVPVYCYDHFGGPSYINKSNFELARKYNFSGRGFDRKLTGQALFQDIINNYGQAIEGIEYLYQQCETYFCLEKNLQGILTDIECIPLTNIEYVKKNYAYIERINDYYVRELKNRLLIEIDVAHRDKENQNIFTELQKRDRELQEAHQRANQVQDMLKQRDNDLQAKTRELNLVLNSRAWKLFTIIRKIMAKLRLN